MMNTVYSNAVSSAGSGAVGRGAEGSGTAGGSTASRGAVGRGPEGRGATGSAVGRGTAVPAALEIRGLSKDYGDFQLENINLTVPAGSIVGLIGENGAGKSTTIKAIMDIIRRDSGRISIYGQQLADNPTALKEEISVVFDDIHFNKTFTTKQIAAICRSIYTGWDDTAWEQYIEQFKLPKDKMVKDFSKGMRVKLNLAIALSHNSKLLLLDEPTAGLDPVMRDDILDIFLDFMQEEEHAILISSHITSDLEKIADYIAFLHEGRMIFCEPKDDLLYRYGVMRCGREDFGKIAEKDRIAARRQEFQTSVLVRDRQEAARKYPGLVIDPPTIDEIMLFYVKGEK